jgi:hypothetical protein
VAAVVVVVLLARMGQVQTVGTDLTLRSMVLVVVVRQTVGLLVKLRLL